MMVVNVKLPDIRFCDDCPCMNNDCDYGTSCNLGYFKEGCEESVTINIKTNVIRKTFNTGDDKQEKFNPFTDRHRTLRPDCCVSRHGE